MSFTDTILPPFVRIQIFKNSRPSFEENLEKLWLVERYEFQNYTQGKAFPWNDDPENDLSTAVSRAINFFPLPWTDDTFVSAVCDPRGSKNVPTSADSY